ncbi:MAG: acyl-ACP--UDP-N-acetylglucosamine O-acyltransferase [Trueperaceae bacterium]
MKTDPNASEAARTASGAVTPTGARIASGAVVHPRARLAADVVVEHGVVIEDDVEVGPGTRLLVGSVVHAGARIGATCRVGPYAVIGGEPMDTRFRGEPSTAVLEDAVIVREFATVHRATGEGEETRVGSGTLVMSYAHVSHNTRVGAGCVLTTAVQLGGHSRIGDRAVLGSAALVHQFCRVGAYAMLGGASAANTDVLPFAMARGNPARHYRLNAVGLKRNGFDPERYRALERALRLLRLRELDALEEMARQNEDARTLLTFLQTSKRGVARFVTRGRDAD